MPGFPSRWRNALVRQALAPAAAVLLALALGGLILWAAGYNPLPAYGVLWQGAFGSLNNFAEVLLKATPLILIGAGLAVAFRGGFWNIGAEGQLYAGAVAGTVVALALADWPGWALMPLVLLSGAAGGAGWGGLAGWLKVRFNANEVVTTIMLNYVALFVVSYLVTGPLIETAGGNPQTARLAEAATLPRFLPPTRLHVGFLLALGLALLLQIILFKTSLGYAIRAVGHSPEAARYAGMRVSAHRLLVMALSGGLAGLAGAVEVAGLTHRLFQSISPGYGYTGIAVALLADNHPLGVIASGIFFGALRSGAEVMQINAGVPSVLVSILQGLALLTAVGLGAYRARAEAE